MKVQTSDMKTSFHIFNTRKFFNLLLPQRCRLFQRCRIISLYMYNVKFYILIFYFKSIFLRSFPAKHFTFCIFYTFLPLLNSAFYSSSPLFYTFLISSYAHTFSLYVTRDYYSLLKFIRILSSK